MRRADDHQDGDNQSVRTQKGVQALTDHSKIRITIVPTILYRQDLQGVGLQDFAYRGAWEGGDQRSEALLVGCCVVSSDNATYAA